MEFSALPTSSSRSINEFISYITQRGQQLAVITPASGFIGSHLAEALLAQNLAVLCEVTNNEQAVHYTKHLASSLSFFITEHSHSHDLPANLPPPRFIIYDIDESFRHFKDSDDISFTVSLETKRLLEYATSSQAKFLLLSHIDPNVDNPYLPLPKESATLEHETVKHFQELRRFVQTLITESIHKSKLNARIVQYADVFGPRMDLMATNSFITKLIADAAVNHAISIVGDGLAHIRPIYISDFIYGVIKSLFSEGSEAKTYTLANPTQGTVLNFATEVQYAAAELGMHVDITFINNDQANHYILHTAYPSDNVGELLWDPKVDMRLGLLRTLSFFMPLHNPNQPTPQTHHPQVVASHIVQPPITAITKHPEEAIIRYHQPLPPTAPIKTIFSQAESRINQSLSFLGKSGVKPAREPRRLGKLGVFLISIGLAGILMASPFVLFQLFAERTDAAVGKSLKEPTNNQAITQALAAINTTQSLLEVTPLNFIISTSRTELVDNQFSLRYIEHALLSTQAVNGMYEELNNILKPTKKPLDQVFTQVTVNAQRAQENIALAQAEEKLIKSPGRFAAIFKQTQDQMAGKSDAIAAATGTVRMLKILFADKQEKTFAILVIDNNELRPSGGRVVGLLSVTLTGQAPPTIASHTITDPNLTLSENAPEAVKTYLRHSKLTIEDSLWNPSFADAIQSFYPTIATVIGKQVAGIIGIDMTALQALLGVTGPVTLSQYSDNTNTPFVIGQDDFAEKLGKIYELSTIANGDKRSQISAELAKAVLERLAISEASFQKLSKTINQSYREHHLLFDFRDPELTNALTPAGTQTPGKPEGNDFIGVFDANVGLNKVNPFVKRTIHHDLIITQKEEVSERLVITYANAATSNQWPLGNYQTYTRVLLPKDRKVTRVVVNDKKPTLAPETEDQATSKSVGLLVTVAPATSQVVTIEYQRTRPLTFTNAISNLTMVVLKQAGTTADPYELAVQLPESLRLEDTKNQFEQFADGYLVKTLLQTNKSFSIPLTRL